MNNRNGFTLVEVIAVVVILGVILMIAVPSITGLSNRSKEKQITEDAKMFEELVKAKIESDTTIEIGGTAKFTLKSIEGKLSADYDEDNSYVEVSDCDYNNNKYSCSTYDTYLYPKSGDYGYGKNGYIQNPENKTGHDCGEKSWCIDE